MRSALDNLRHRSPDHLGLAYETWAPVEDSTGKLIEHPIEERAAWFERLQSISCPDGYAGAFNRWHAALKSTGTSMARVFKLSSRMLVGHGLAAPTEVGLTLHHTWGVPIIPGSSLKGVLSHYIDACLGPDAGLDTDTERQKFRGVIYKEGRPVQPAGDYHRNLFGGPAIGSSQDEDARVDATQGAVIFHDAWWVPNGNPTSLPVTQDVLTPHQRQYYTTTESWPCDYDDPNPVGFLSVKPNTEFLVAISGPTDWVRFAMTWLESALLEWGVGGKSSSGYGHATRIENPRLDFHPVRVKAPWENEFEKILEQAKDLKNVQKKTQKEVLEAIRNDLASISIPEDEREACARKLIKILKRQENAIREILQIK